MKMMCFEERHQSIPSLKAIQLFSTLLSSHVGAYDFVSSLPQGMQTLWLPQSHGNVLSCSIGAFDWQKSKQFRLMSVMKSRIAVRLATAEISVNKSNHNHCFISQNTEAKGSYSIGDQSVWLNGRPSLNLTNLCLLARLQPIRKNTYHLDATHDCTLIVYDLRRQILKAGFLWYQQLINRARGRGDPVTHTHKFNFFTTKIEHIFPGLLSCIVEKTMLW